MTISDFNSLLTDNFQKIILYDINKGAEIYSGFIDNYDGFDYEICSIDCLFCSTDTLTFNVDSY